MTYLAVGLTFLVVSFLFLSTVASVLTMLLWSVLRSRRLGADAIFRLRMLPTGASIFALLLLVLPAFLLFEPTRTEERVGMKAVLLILIASVLIGAGVWRTLGAWLATRRCVRGWQAAAELVPDEASGVPVYRIRTDLPLAALVGIRNPRVLVSDRFFDALSVDERDAVLRHETEHLVAFDNAKRILMRFAPDWISFLAMGREMEGAWVAAAEEEADARAAGVDRARALDLAYSLLKAARLMPAGRSTLLAASGFSDPATLSRRVAKLLEGGRESSGSARRGALVPAGFALLSAMMLLVEPALPIVYALAEAAVRSLE